MARRWFDCIMFPSTVPTMLENLQFDNNLLFSSTMNVVEYQNLSATRIWNLTDRGVTNGGGARGAWGVTNVGGARGAWGVTNGGGASGIFSTIFSSLVRLCNTNWISFFLSYGFERTFWSRYFIWPTSHCFLNCLFNLLTLVATNIWTTKTNRMHFR